MKTAGLLLALSGLLFSLTFAEGKGAKAQFSAEHKATANQGKDDGADDEEATTPAEEEEEVTEDVKEVTAQPRAKAKEMETKAEAHSHPAVKHHQVSLGVGL